MRRQRGRRAFRRFLLPRERSDQWLAVLRIGLGATLLLYCLVLRRDWHLVLATDGPNIITRRVSEALLAIESSLIPTVAWFVEGAAHLGLSEQTTLDLIWGILVISAGCLLLGIFCRFAAITAWLLHLATAKSGGMMTYGVDTFMTIGLFYLMLSPLPDSYAWEQRWRRRTPHPRAFGFSRRVLQLHLCVAYFFSGLMKLLGSGWWDGSNLWRALIRPPFDVLPANYLASVAWLLPIAGIAICLIELCYAALIWPARTRLITLSLVCAMHLGIALLMRLYLFALVMIVLNLAAFAPALSRARRRALFPLDDNSFARDDTATEGSRRGNDY